MGQGCLPAEELPWRVTREARTSYCEDSDLYTDHELTIEAIRSGPMQPCTQMELLWAFSVDPDHEPAWAVTRENKTAFLLKGPAGQTCRFDRAAMT